MRITKDGKMEMEYLVEGVGNDGFSDDKGKNERVLREMDLHRDILLIEEVFGKDTETSVKKINEFIGGFIMAEIERIPLQTKKAFLRAIEANKR